jgi:hypothetical protein
MDIFDAVALAVVFWIRSNPKVKYPAKWRI